MFSPLRVFRGLLVLAPLLLVACGSTRQPPPLTPPPPPCFTDAERKAVQTYWSAPGRYSIQPTPLILNRVNITVAGSVWYLRALGAVADCRKTDPIAAASWEDWLKRKAGYEKATLMGTPGTTAPESLPDGLRDTAGFAPSLYENVRPNQYTVTFAPEDSPTPFVYEDAIDFGKRSAYFAYYRQSNGVIRAGKRLKDYDDDEMKRLNGLFGKVAKSDTEKRVLRAVSALEGGFEAINTYDTGFVSIGFIQFITAQNGDGSLAAVLSRYKIDDYKDYNNTFRRFGIDVATDTVLCVVEPTTGEEKRGADAVKAVIDDKRLTAVFERAGMRDGFRLAQIATARERYWPGDDLVTVQQVTLYEQKGDQATPTVLGTYWGVPDLIPEVQKAVASEAERREDDPEYRVWTEVTPVTAKAGDLVRSEAGLATLMDRKVNRGNIRLMNDVVLTLLRDKKLSKLEDVRKYEKDIVVAMKYRTDFLADPTLKKP